VRIEDDAPRNAGHQVGLVAAKRLRAAGVAGDADLERRPRQHGEACFDAVQWQTRDAVAGSHFDHGACFVVVSATAALSGGRARVGRAGQRQRRLEARA
jgi:hypothetical protein